MSMANAEVEKKTKTAPINVIVISENESLGRSVKNTLETASPELSVKGLRPGEEYRQEPGEAAGLVFLDLDFLYRDAAKAVKSVKKQLDTPVIVITGIGGSQKQLINALDAGADDFIVKPWRREDLLDTVGRVFWEASHAG